MRPISSILLANLKNEEYIPAILLDVSVTGIGDFYLTTWSERLLFSSNNYYPRGMEFDTIAYGSSAIVDNVSLKVDDVDRALYAAFAERGSEPFPTSITLVVLSLVGEVLASTVIFVGNVSGWSYSPGSIRFKVVSVLDQWARVPTNTYSGSCRWNVFKGPECKYAGGESFCDRTYTQCDETYNNTNNFGGFRWLQSLAGKTITPGHQDVS